MRRPLLHPSLAATLGDRARRPLPAAIPLYLPAYGDRFVAVPEAGDDEEPDVDAAAFTVGGDEDDDGYL